MLFMTWHHTKPRSNYKAVLSFQPWKLLSHTHGLDQRWELCSILLREDWSNTLLFTHSKGLFPSAVPASTRLIFSSWGIWNEPVPAKVLMKWLVWSSLCTVSPYRTLPYRRDSRRRAVEEPSYWVHVWSSWWPTRWPAPFWVRRWQNTAGIRYHRDFLWAVVWIASWFHYHQRVW